MIGAQDVKPDSIYESLKENLNNYVEVAWFDASFEFQVDKDNVERITVPLVVTIGKCIRVDASFVVLAAEELPEEFRSVTLVPLNLIKRIRTLR